MYGELASGHRNRGAPKQQYKDELKKYMIAVHISSSEWSALIKDHYVWLHATRKAASTFKELRSNSLEEKKTKEER